MRLLYLASDLLPDFLQDLLFHGLVQTLGRDNVTPFPRHVRYEAAAPEGTRYPQLWLGFQPWPERSLEDAVEEADAIVVATLRPPVRELLPRVLALRGRRPLAFVDGEDDPYVRGIVGEADLYFKRETLASARRLRARMPLRRRWHALRRRPTWSDPLARELLVATAADGVVPLPLGIVDVGYVPPVRREFDVGFLSTPGNAERAHVLRQVEALRAEGLRVLTAPATPVGWREYLDLLAGCRVSISVRGLGYDTFRYWEIPYAGSVLLAETPAIVIPANFVDGVEAVFAPRAQLADRARALLLQDTEAIARAGRQALLARHTSIHRARVVLDRLEPLVDGATG